MEARKLLMAAVLPPLVLAGSACGSGSTASPSQVATVTVTATATATVTTTQAQTPVPSPASEKATGHLGMVWASQVDPARINQPLESQPTFDGGDGIVVRIEQLDYVDASRSGDLGEQCSGIIEQDGKSGDTHCLYAQWVFDVPENYKADEAHLSPGVLLTPDGRQIGNYTTTSAVPGAKNVAVNAMYEGGVPGSTLWWSVGSNKRDWKKLKFAIPGVESFKPINFD